MPPSRRRRRRLRSASPLDVRSWVTGRAAPEVYAELSRRIDALDAVAQPHAEFLVQGGRYVAMMTLEMLGSDAAIGTLPAEVERTIARVGAANMVATHWAHHEYRPRMILPAVMINSVPWDILPDRIHVLDLTPQHILAASVPGRTAITAVRAARRGLSEADKPALLFGAAHGMIDRFGPLALLSPVVIAAIVSYLSLAQYAPTKNAADDGARAADVLLDALRADLSRRLVRSSDRLPAMRRAFERLLTRAREFKELLQSHRPPRVVLATAKDWFGAWVDYRDLRRWERHTPTAIATEVLADQLGIGQKALRDQRRLADTAQDIAEAWQAFVAYLKTRPHVEQRRITEALAVPASQPQPGQSSSSTSE